jgi:alpha-tubulin suppressor-like RCC1 family protein
MTDGNTPAEGAVVTVFHAGHLDKSPVHCAITDKFGRFSLQNLIDGYYGIWAQKDSFVLFQDSVRITSDLSTLHDDTLEFPSSLTATVAVEFPHDAGTVTIGLEGTCKQLTIQDSTGQVFLNGLAAGTYTLDVESSHPGYLLSRRRIIIAQHSSEIIKDTIRCNYNGIPYIKNIQATEDTLAQTVTITWSRSSCSNIQDYIIYRDVGPAFDLSSEPVAATTDTFFVDKDLMNHFFYVSDTNFMPCKYRIAVRTINQETGPTVGYEELRFVLKSMVTTSCSHSIQYRGDECRLVSVGDTVTFYLSARNPTRQLEKLIWFDSTQQDTIAVVKIDSPDTGWISDSLNCSFADTGKHSLQAIFTDNAGTEWFYTMPLRIIIDTLAALAGNDTGVFSGNSFLLHGDVFDRFGNIIEWKWKIGSGSWTRTSGPDTTVIAPLTEELLVCSLSVTDEDGAIRKDEILIMCSLPVIRTAANAYHSMILKSGGELWACGRNDHGQLGDGTLINRFLPVYIINGIRSMALGHSHSLIVKNDGTLWVCGDNSNGQFGNGTLEGHVTPHLVMNDVQQVAANSNYSLILKTDGTLLSCGWVNSVGQNDTASANGYRPVVMMTGVQSMSAGIEHIMILKLDGTLWSCGKNTYGQLGDGTKIDRLEPAQIMTGVKSVDVNGSHSMILKTDGTLWSCGMNYSAQLSYYGYYGSTRSRSTPVQIMTDVLSMSAGWYHSLIVKTDSSLWAAGYNPAYGYTGQFGTYNNRFTSVQVMTGVKQVAGGWNYSMIVKTDGSLWGCGENENGQIGNGSRGFLSEPVSVVPFHCYELSIRQMQNE